MRETERERGNNAENMRELVESVFIIKNSLAQSWNAFVLKYAANCSSISSHKSAQEQQEWQVEWGRKKRRNKNVCIMIIATINWVQHKAYLQHVATKQMTRKIAFNFCCLFFLSGLFSFCDDSKTSFSFYRAYGSLAYPARTAAIDKKWRSAWLSFFCMSRNLLAISVALRCVHGAN